MTISKLSVAAGAAVLLLGTIACESIVEDINNDPNNFTEVTLPLALGQAGLGTAAISNQHSARIASMWSDQFTGTDRQYISINSYNVDASDFDNPWEDIYQRALPMAQIAKEIAIEQGAAVPQGVATIFEAYYFGEAAALYGDVPFTQANDIVEFPDPAYDSQEDVLQGAVGLLDEALELVGESSVSAILGDVFTSTATWAQVAHGLKARYLLLLEDYDGAYEAATAANMDEVTDGLAVQASEANFGENLWWQFQVEQRSDYLSVANDGGTSTLLSLLLSDSERTRTNEKTDDGARLQYYADTTAPTGYIIYNVTDGFAAIDAPMQVLSAPEVALIRAEAALEKSSPEPDSALAALNTAREFWDALLGTDNYEDYELDDFDDGGIADLDDGDLESALLREVIEEKFVSVIGLPTFYDINRRGNKIGAEAASGAAIPQRYLYPSTERSSNATLDGVTLPGLFDPTPVNM